MPVQPFEQTEYIGAHRAEEEAVSWRSMLGQIAGRTALVMGLAAGGLTTVETSAPDAAHAEYRKTNGSCRGAFFGIKQEVCVVGTMGEKNPWLGKEWVHGVTVKTPDSGNGFLEIWGDGFYKSMPDGDDYHWEINKWVSTDTNICGASTDKENRRAIACFRISVE
jgi:hypothetical protein